VTDVVGQPRFGEATIEDCAREPIRTPGAVRPHAAVLVVDRGTVVRASGNAAAVLGAGGPVVSQPLERLLGDEVAGRFAALDPSSGPRTQTTRLPLPGGEVDVCRTAAGGLAVFEVEPVAGAQDGAASFEDAVTAAVTRMQHVSDLTEIVDQVVGLVAELTGFDRVMGYRFEPDDHGVVSPSATARARILPRAALPRLRHPAAGARSTRGSGPG
jgi:two-component system, chemotaxis family, sensor kinase Cph1